MPQKTQERTAHHRQGLPVVVLREVDVGQPHVLAVREVAGRKAASLEVVAEAKVARGKEVSHRVARVAEHFD